MPPSVQEAVKQADAVVLGRVHRFEIRNRRRTATIRVTTVWKGTPSRWMTVNTGNGEGDCGFHFVAGLTCVVFANQVGWGEFSTTSCDWNQPIDGPQPFEFLKALGPGTAVK